MKKKKKEREGKARDVRCGRRKEGGLPLRASPLMLLIDAREEEKKRGGSKKRRKKKEEG